MIQSLKIKNYKSIGETEQILDNLGLLNTLIGENSSGKTAVLEALWLVGEIALSFLSEAQLRSPLSLIEGSAKLDPNDFLNKTKNLLRNINSVSDLIHQKGKMFELEIAFCMGGQIHELLRSYIEEGGEVLRKKMQDKVGNTGVLKIKIRMDFGNNTFKIADIMWGNLALSVRQNNRKRSINLQNFLNIPDRSAEYSRASFSDDEFCRQAFLPMIANFLVRLSNTYYIHSKRQIKEVMPTHDNSKDIKGTCLKRDLYHLFHGTSIEKEQHEKILEVFYKVTNKQIRKTPFVSRDHRTDVVFKEGSIDVNIDNAGYGYYQMLLQIYNIITSKASIILIDEPELSLHPQMQIKFLEVIKDIANREKKQFLITTHSPYFIDLQFIDKVYKFTKPEGTTSITQVSNKKVIERIRKRGETVFHFRHRELFFMDKVMFVEGNDDLNILPQFLCGDRIDPFISREHLYQLVGIDENKIEFFSSFCKDIKINCAFVVDADFLRKGDIKNDLIEGLKNAESPPNSTKQLLEILGKGQIQYGHKKQAREIWIKDWKKYWILRGVQDLLKKLQKKHIFVMPFYDVNTLLNTADTELNKAVSDVFIKIAAYFQNPRIS
jgi:predicted ATP-dependent endonuclease of OLD family